MLSQKQQMELWDPDWWIEGEKDVGILIVDETDVNTRAWDCKDPIVQTGGTVIAGDFDSTRTFNDGNYYRVRDTTTTGPDLVITPTIDGVVVADTDFLKHIEIQYSFRLKVKAGLDNMGGTIYFEILKDTEWLPIAHVTAKDYFWYKSHTTNWVMGIPLEEYDGATGCPYNAPDDTDVELRKYFNKDNGNYSELKGLRFRLAGYIGVGGYMEIHVDYIKVKVGYDTYDIFPIMEPITDNTGTTITCADVSAWDETGVVENDGFKIGENTKAIIQDIANESGLDIRIIHGTSSPFTRTVDPDADSVDDNWEDATGGDGEGDLFDEIDDYGEGTQDNDYITITAVNGTCKVECEGRNFDSTAVITGIKVYARAKYVGAGSELLRIGYECTGGSASTGVAFKPAGAFTEYTHEVTGLEYDYDDVVDMKITLQNFHVTGGANNISAVKIVYTYTKSTFDKYMAREFKGNRCREPLKAVCKLEGALWYEDYENDRIVVVKPADLVDSGVDLTEADYDGPWEYADDCNQVKSFLVFGKSEDNIFAKAVDETVNSYISEQLIDESITNVGDAQRIANTQLALINSKRPSIRLPLTVDNTALQLGKTVDVTFARPTIAKATYTIRKLERKRRGINDIALTIWVGLGESTQREMDAKFIRDNMFRSHKALTNKLISP